VARQEPALDPDEPRDQLELGRIEHRVRRGGISDQRAVDRGAAAGAASWNTDRQGDPARVAAELRLFFG
jgi:hypothetical protein